MPHHTIHSPAPRPGSSGSHLHGPSDGGACLGRTCMKWGADGELAELDFQLILQRLCEVDAEACAALAEDFDEATG